jgi:hypothetical protein
MADPAQRDVSKKQSCSVAPPPAITPVRQTKAARRIGSRGMAALAYPGDPPLPGPCCERSPNQERQAIQERGRQLARANKTLSSNAEDDGTGTSPCPEETVQNRETSVGSRL